MQNIKLSDIENDPIKAKILLVDDEELILNSLKMTLKRYFTVFTTQDPTKVASIIEENDIDLLISDEIPPYKSGFDAQFVLHVFHPLGNHILYLLEWCSINLIYICLIFIYSYSNS